MSEQPPINLGQTPAKPDPGFGAPGSPPKNNTKLIIGLIAGVVGLIVVGCCVCCVVPSIFFPAKTERSNDGENGADAAVETNSGKATSTSSRFKGITEAGYDEIEDGMAEAVVEAILGQGSELASAAKIKTVTYEKGFKIITITYQDGRVAGKAKTF